MIPVGYEEDKRITQQFKIAWNNLWGQRDGSHQLRVQTVLIDFTLGSPQAPITPAPGDLDPGICTQAQAHTRKNTSSKLFMFKSIL